MRWHLPIFQITDKRINMLRYLQIVSILLISSILFSCSDKKEEVTTSIDVMPHVDEFENKTEWLNYRIALESWELYTTGQADSLDFYNGLYRKLLEEPELIAAMNEKNPQIEDEDDLRRFHLVQKAVLSGQVEEQQGIVSIRDSLSKININYRAQFEGNSITSNKLYKIFRSDNSRTRRESAYRAWVSVGTEMQEGIQALFVLRNQQAKKLGFKNYFELSLNYQGIDLDEYKTLLDELESLTEKPYAEILQKIKGKLRVSDPEIWDISYAYKNINSKIDDYLPVDSQMRFIKRSLKNIGFDINKLPIFFDLESRPGKSQFAYAFTIKAPDDMRVLANLTDGILSTKTLMHEIGHALHSGFIKQDKSLFSNIMIDGIWAEAMGQTLASLINNRDWLTNYARIPKSVADAYLDSKKETDIIYLRTTLMRLNFELEAYQNPQKGLNVIYWDLFEKFMMLPRHDDIYPWASIIHYTTHPVYLQNYLYADMIAAQNIAFLNESYGSIVANNNTKSFLVQNYFRFGAKYDWRELLKRGTDSKLKPEHFITSLGL